MRVGVDSYSYHRLLGEVRQGELPPAIPPFARGSLDALAAIRATGADVASLETVFLPPPGRLDCAALLDAAGPLELALAWGHPDGLAWGADAAALSELRAWIRLAPRLGCRLVRIVAASPRLRRAGTPADQLAATARAVRRALAEAESAGVALAIENHGDLTGAMLVELLDRCPGLGVCFDTANALRVGDDPLAAAVLLADHVRIVHLKDCEPLDPNGRGSPAGPRSVPCGEGVVPVAAVLDALAPALAAGAPVCVELAQLGPEVADERALVADGVAWLRRWAGHPAEQAKREPA